MFLTYKFKYFCTVDPYFIFVTLLQKFCKFCEYGSTDLFPDYIRIRKYYSFVFCKTQKCGNSFLSHCLTCDTVSLPLFNLPVNVCPLWPSRKNFFKPFILFIFFSISNVFQNFVPIFYWNLITKITKKKISVFTISLCHFNVNTIVFMRYFHSSLTAKIKKRRKTKFSMIDSRMQSECLGVHLSA